MTLTSTIYRAAFCLNRKAEFLGECIRQRRFELGISIAEAADLSGITMWQWAAMEHGLWIPEDGPVLHSIAGTLEADYLGLSFCAQVSRVNQPEQQVVQ
jgi:hypothetical protein